MIAERRLLRSPSSPDACLRGFGRVAPPFEVQLGFHLVNESEKSEREESEKSEKGERKEGEGGREKKAKKGSGKSEREGEKSEREG